MDAKLQIFNYNGSAISFNRGDSVMVNATEMAKPFGKKPVDWLKTESSKRFIDALCEVKSFTSDELVKVVYGDNGGTWMHEDVAIEFARWLAPPFAIWMNDRIKELFTKGSVSLMSDDEKILSVINLLQERVEKVREENRILTEQNGKLAIKAKYTTDVLQSVDGLTFTQVAKDLGLSSEKKLETFLEQKKIIFWQSGQWMATWRYADKGYFTNRTYHFIEKSTGKARTSIRLIITERGRAWLHFLFEKEKKKNAKEKKQAAVAAIPQVTYTQTEIFS